MYYTYVLISKEDDKMYIGSTSDLTNRFNEHNNGKVKSTRHRIPFKILFYEVYVDKKTAVSRENFLKTSDGHKDIKKRFDKK